LLGFADTPKVGLNAALFVDDEESMCDMYRSFAHVLQEHYEVVTANSGAEGVEMLRARSFDVVVTDLTMPDMDGLRFLAHVVKHQPDSARIIISGYADRIKIARCLFIGHRYFNKPFDAAGLAHLLIRLASFRELVGNQKVRRVIGGLGALPGPPETFLKIEKALESVHASIQDVAELVEQDVAVTAKLLQIVNSAQFGINHKVLSVSEAVQLVGVEAVRGLVLGLQAFAGYKEQPGKKAPPAALWDHSLRTALGARRIARSQRFPLRTADRAFLAGLLHDVGRIVLDANVSEERAAVNEFAQRFGISIAQAEQRHFGASHGEIGAYLLALWGIDDEVVRLVQYQEALSAYEGEDPAALAALHVAHCVDANDPQAYPLDMGSLTSLGFANAESWIEEAEQIEA
jgi:HD-like signal output (HDOD) protein/ActR/RegA family two-component response regulator